MKHRPSHPGNCSAHNAADESSSLHFSSFFKSCKMSKSITAKTRRTQRNKRTQQSVNDAWWRSGGRGSRRASWGQNSLGRWLALPIAAGLNFFTSSEALPQPRSSIDNFFHLCVYLRGRGRKDGSPIFFRFIVHQLSAPERRFPRSKRKARIAQKPSQRVGSVTSPSVH